MAVPTKTPTGNAKLVATFSSPRRVDAFIVVPAGPDHGDLRERAGGVALAFLGGREAIHTAVERRRGYHEALKEHEIAEDPRLLRTDLCDASDAHAAARQLCLAAEPPTAIFSAQNLLTLGTLRLDGDDRPYSQHVLPTTLTARGSGEIPPPASRR